MSETSPWHQLAANRGVLLRASQATGPSAGLALRLTFDLGVLEVRARAGRLVVEAIPAESQSSDTAGWSSADEEEPWWKLLGQPLTQVVESTDDGVVLQWRAENDNPCTVVFATDSGTLEVGVRP